MTDDWAAEVHERTDGERMKDKLKLEVRGVVFVFDSVTIGEDTYKFALKNTVNVQIDRDDMPDGVYEWLGDHTDGFGNAVAPPDNEH